MPTRILLRRFYFEVLSEHGTKGLYLDYGYDLMSPTSHKGTTARPTEEGNSDLTAHDVRKDDLSQHYLISVGVTDSRRSAP